MECRDYRDWLPLFADAGLTQRELIRLQKHFAECPACEQRAREYCRLLALLKPLSEEVKLPEDFYLRLQQRLQTDAVRSSKPWLLWPPLVLGTTVAAGLLLAVLILPTTPWRNGTPSQSADPAGSSSLGRATDPASPGTEASRSLPSRRARENLLESRVSEALNLARPATRPLTPPTPLVTQAEMKGPELPAWEGIALGLRGMGRNGLTQPVAFSQLAPASAAYPQPPAPETAAVRPEGATPFSATDWSGEQCGVDVPALRVVRTPEEFQRLWAEANISPTMPKLVWGTQMLAAIFLGKRPGKGYEIRLQEIRNSGSSVLIKYTVRPPANPQAQEISRPYLLVLLPYTTLPVELQEE